MVTSDQVQEFPKTQLGASVGVHDCQKDMPKPMQLSAIKGSATGRVTLLKMRQKMQVNLAPWHPLGRNPESAQLLSEFQPRLGAVKSPFFRRSSYFPTASIGNLPSLHRCRPATM